MKKNYLIGTHNIISYVALKMALALLLLLVTQAIFAVVNHGLFCVASAQEEARPVAALLSIVVGNLHFGIAGTCMFCAPFVVFYALPLRARWTKGYQAVGRWIYGVPVAVMLAANMIDVPYYQWTLRRMAGDIFGYVGGNFEGGFGDLLGEMVTGFWYYFLIYFALIALMIWLSRNIVLVATRHATSPRESESGHPRSSLLSDILVSLLLLALTLTGVRGGWIWQHKPLAPIDASRYTHPTNAALVVNTPFSIVRTLGNTTGLVRTHYFDSEEALEAVFSPVIPPRGEVRGSHPNIVLIILESFSEEYMGCICHKGEKSESEIVSYTPFLDSLAQHSTVYAGRANGKRSIESLPALLLGIPSLMDEAYITSPYSLNHSVSLPQILRRHGYESAFFHGAYNGSMNFDGFAKMVGIDHYYGMDEYGDTKDFDGTWGIFDEPFLQFGVREIGTLRQPFFATVYTISSHHPYTIPPQHVGRCKMGDIPLLETVGYADYALRRFFEAARQTPWFENTLFVITADHAAQPLSDHYRQWAYNVPMILYRPGEEPCDRRTQLFQHIDLMPTLVDMLGLGDTCFSFGHNVGDGRSYHIAYPGNYHLLEHDGRLVTFDGTKFEGSPTPEEQEFLKAVIQQYNNRMIDNRLMP